MDCIKDMWIAGLLAFTYLCLYFLVRRLTYKSSPASIYFLIWTIVLFLYSLRLVRYEDINVVQYNLIFGSGFAFFLGSILGRFSFSSKFEVNKKNRPFCIDNNRLLKWIIGLNLLAIVGFIAFLIKLCDGFSLFYLLQHLNIANWRIENLNEGITGYLRMLVVPALDLCEIAFLESKRRVLILFFIIDFLILFSSTRRTLAFFAILSFVFIYYYWYLRKEKVSFKMTKQNAKLFAFGSILAFGLVMYFNYIQIALKKSISYNSQYFTIRLPIWANNILTYATASIAAIPAFLRERFASDVPFGYSLRPIYVMLNNFFPSSVPVPYFAREFVRVPVTTNVLPYFMYWYFDFGFIYMLMIVFLMAFLSERFFAKFLNTSSPFLLVISSFFSSGFLLSIRQNIFLTIYFWYFVIIIYVVFRTTFRYVE